MAADERREYGRMTRFDRGLVALLVAYIAMLAILPFLLSAETFDAAFSETGPFERLSPDPFLGAELGQVNQPVE